MRPFEEIVVEHGAVVMRVCRALLDHHAADDAWADTFMSAMRAYPDLRPDSNVRGWLVTIAHRRCLDHIRRARRSAEPVERMPEAPAGETAQPFDAQLRAAVRALPTKQRHAVVYRYLADLSYGDIARLLECSEAAARRSAADGIASLRAHYTKGSLL